VSRWYETEDFTRDFLPWIRPTAAWDNRKGKPRFDLKSNTPPHIRTQMLSFKAPCAHCSRPMHPFRERKGQESVYVAVSCEDGLSGSCSKGSRASSANASLGEIVKKYQERQGPQGGPFL
jgi:hypothetical protein